MSRGSDSPILSLIIAHYNHRESLPLLLDSVLRQSLRGIEVIVVDDCSPVSCRDITEAYCNKGLTINFIQHETNRGQKDSRCTGIANAQGKVIGFADADDSLYGSNNLEHHTKMMLEYNTDIVHFLTLRNYCATSEHLVQPWDIPYAPVLYGDDIFSTYVNSKLGMHTVWNKLYSRDLCLRSFEFYRDSKVRWAHDDLYLTTWFFFQAKSYRGSDKIGYFYNNDYEATKHRHAAGRMIDDYIMLLELIPYLKQHGCSSDLLEKCRKQFIWFMMREFSFICEKCYDNEHSNFNENIFMQLIYGKNSLIIEELLKYSLIEAQNNSEYQKYTKKLEECITIFQKK